MSDHPIDQIIRRRKTSKMLSAEPVESSLDQKLVQEIIELAGWAPFHLAASPVHRKRLTEASLVPWRFHVLPKQICLSLRQRLLDQGDRSKVPDMLAAADILIQATWCPDPDETGAALDEEFEFIPTVSNMEHIAATAAAVQNLLLAATARNISTYWSSGGPIRKREVASVLGIPADEVLLGSIFLFPKQENYAEVTVRPGKMREKRGAPAAWCRWITTLEE
ncbi:MAG: nitroreductase family protein [Arenicellales bacterium]